MTWEEFSAKEYEAPQFLIDPFIVRGGITFLWGETSTGKSPVTWAIAQAVASGRSFFGLPAAKGRVLYVELDTPEQSLHERLKGVQPTPNVWWWVKPCNLNVPQVLGETLESLYEAAEMAKPDLVIIDTLRKVHLFDDRESKTPAIVYGFFQRLFPNSALVFVHHTRKQSQDPRAIAVDKESFSGSNAWLNDVQCGLHLEPYDGEGANIRLYHRKSQVSPLLKPLPLYLGPDGSTLTSPLFNQLLLTYDFLNSEEADALNASERDAALARLLKVSTGTAKRRRLDVEGGDFPLTRKWLETHESLKGVE